MAHKGQTGASLGGGLEKSPERRKRERKKRQREERRWARKSGPVTVRIDPSIIKRPPEHE